MPTTKNIFLAIALILSAYSPGQSLQNKEVYTYLDEKGLQEIFTKEEIAFERLEENIFDITLNGFSANAAVNPDGDLFLTSYFKGEGVTLEQINQFNADHRWCRIYLDDEGDVAVQTELSFTGGIHRDGIIMFINTFAKILEDVNDSF